MRPEDAGPEPAEVFVEIAPDRHEIADVVPAALPRACKPAVATLGRSFSTGAFPPSIGEGLRLSLSPSRLGAP
jgi:hypothetical protein